MLTPKNADGLTALWSIKLPALISNDVALFSGIFMGLLIPKLLPNKSKEIAQFITKLTNIILSGIVFVIPLFILGFVIKMCHDGTIKHIVTDYAPVFALIALSQFFYIFFLFFTLNQFSLKNFFKNLKNMFPAVFSGFTTMSSAASMPLAIMGVKNNTKNKELASSTLPMTVNIHLIGDCFAIPILAYAILKGFNFPAPSLYEYMIFSVYFVLAKFSVAAIPGGGILVMLPVLEKYFGFSAEMLSLITALYILFDPVITSANILGNGAFAKIIDKIYSHSQKPVALQKNL